MRTTDLQQADGARRSSARCGSCRNCSQPLRRLTEERFETGCDPELRLQQLPPSVERRSRPVRPRTRVSTEHAGPQLINARRFVEELQQLHVAQRIHAKSIAEEIPQILEVNRNAVALQGEFRENSQCRGLERSI